MLWLEYVLDLLPRPSSDHCPAYQGPAEEPVAGTVSTRNVSDAEIDVRFAAFPLPVGTMSTVVSKRLLYVMPENVTEAVVEPLLVYRYNLRHISDPARLASRVKEVGFSLTDPAATPRNLSPEVSVPSPSVPK